MHGSRVLVFHAVPSLLEHLNATVDSLEQIERLESGDDDRDAKTLGQRLVLLVAHDRANVAGPEKALHAVTRR